MATRSPHRPSSPDRHLRAVSPTKPTLGDRLREKGVTPLRAAGAGVAAVAAIVALSQVPRIGEAPGPDPRIERNEAAEKGALAPLFNAEQTAVMPFSSEIGKVDQFRGSITIRLDEQTPLANINLRATPFMQRDEINGELEDSNALIKIGDLRADDEAIRDARAVTLVDPLSITAEDGTVYYGGVFTEPEQNPPIADATQSPDAFSSSMYWVNGTALQEQYSGASFDMVPGEAQYTVALHADPNIDGGPYLERLPVIYVGENQK